VKIDDLIANKHHPLTLRRKDWPSNIYILYDFMWGYEIFDNVLNNYDIDLKADDWELVK
jgi:hypothetical protein